MKNPILQWEEFICQLRLNAIFSVTIAPEASTNVSLGQAFLRAY
jgi:hypothetical protein